jgi:preprotein translocase subunit SecE
VSKIKEYLNETVTEMVHNVTWPTWKELQSNTIIVVVASVIISLFIFVMDFGFGIVGNSESSWRGVLGFIYDMFK